VVEYLSTEKRFHDVCHYSNTPLLQHCKIIRLKVPNEDYLDMVCRTINKHRIQYTIFKFKKSNIEEGSRCVKQESVKGQRVAIAAT
jgi:hypothetical protein